MKRLGYLVPAFPSQTHAFFWREAEALRAEGREILWLSTRRPAETDCPHAFAGEARDRTTYLFPPKGAALLALLGRLYGLAAALRYVLGLTETGIMGRLRLCALIPSAAWLAAISAREGLEHIHVHSCADAAHLVGLARRFGGPPFSLTLHGDLAVYGRDHGVKIAEAALVTVVSQPLVAQIQAFDPARSVPVIPMGVDTERFRPAPRRERAADSLHVVSISRLNWIKGHRFALEAIASLGEAGQGITYAIAGDGEERGAIEAQIARLGLAERVQVLGPIGEDAVIDLLHSADAFALTSIGQGEATPVAVMESMACGLPVICSRIGGTPDMITDAEDGYLVEQEYVSAIAERLAALAADPALRARLGAAARARAVGFFDFRARARALGAAIDAA
ncbi:MAG: glycosyltransferase [Pseudomonadota bacterium]